MKFYLPMKLFEKVQKAEKAVCGVHSEIIDRDYEGNPLWEVAVTDDYDRVYHAEICEDGYCRELYIGHDLIFGDFLGGFFWDCDFPSKNEDDHRKAFNTFKNLLVGRVTDNLLEAVQCS